MWQKKWVITSTEKQKDVNSILSENQKGAGANDFVQH